MRLAEALARRDAARFNVLAVTHRRITEGVKMKKKVDITGLMVQAKPGWEVRAEGLAKPEYFWISIGIDPDVRAGLTNEEYKRLGKKLELVRQAATYMAAGMVKGTVKYSHDNYSIEQWIAHVVGEGADQMNYQLLLADALARGKK